MDNTLETTKIKRKVSRITPLARANFDNKPLTKKQAEIFVLYESGLTQQQIADKMGIKQPYVSEVLRIYARRFRINREYIKLNAVNILNSKINEKRDLPSNKDVVDIVESLHSIVEPKKDNIEIVQNKLEINADIDSLTAGERLERVRRLLSDGYST